MSKYDMMIAGNRKASEEKIELAKRTIWQMLENHDKISVPKLAAKTGLSRGFFYKNPSVRREMDRALEQQVGMPDPRRGALELAMDHEILRLRQRVKELQQINQSQKQEIDRLRSALGKKNLRIVRNL